MGDEMTGAANRNLTARHRSLEVAFAVLGWELISVEIDETRGTARLDAKRDGRLVLLHVDHIGRASVERFQDRFYTATIGRRGDRFIAHRADLEFLGRERFDSPRAALRGFVGYLAHNGASGAEALESAVAAALTGGA